MGHAFWVASWSARHRDRCVRNVDHALDSSFIAARVARILASKVAHVQARASLGAEPHQPGDVAAAAGKPILQVAVFRDRLMAEGLIYAARYGWVEFAIPRFDRFVRMAFPPQS